MPRSKNLKYFCLPALATLLAPALAYQELPVGRFRPKAGEAYGRIEAPKGELGFYLISDGSPNPLRYRVRPPSFINLTILEDMCLGQLVGDVVRDGQGDEQTRHSLRGCCSRRAAGS